MLRSVLDDNKNTSDTARFLIVIQSITECFEGVKELSRFISLHGTTGEDLSMCETMKEGELPWTKQQNDAKQTKSRISRGTSPHHPSTVTLWGGMKFKPVMEVVVSVVNFISSHGLNHRQFQSFFFFCRKLIMSIGTSSAIQTSDG
jgi:hypothetical protein